MKWKTSISTRKDDEVYIRGVALSRLMEKNTFPEAIFLILTSRLPNKKELALFNMMLVAGIEHGIEAPSAFGGRVSASVGNPLHVAAAAGILSVGPWHGGAVEKAAYYLQLKDAPKKIVSDILKSGGRLPGLGHAIYKKIDPRAEALFDKAKKLGLSGTYVARIRALQKELKKQGGKELAINIDGALAALLLELRLDWRLANGIFVLARLPGILAHAHEEKTEEKPYKRISPEDVEYRGKAV